MAKKCIKCNRIVSPRQQAIQCDRCLEWNHRTCNTDISQEEYTEAVNAGTGIQWLCEPCQMQVAESSRISSDSSAAILDSSEFNPTRVDSFKDHPELDTRLTSIQDIVLAELSKKEDKKAKVERKLKQKLQQKQETKAQVKTVQNEKTVKSTKKEEAAREAQNVPPALFSGENFRFGNPFQKFQQELKDAYFNPDVVKKKRWCQKAKYKKYKQRYHKKLLKEILTSRQEILDQIGRQGPGEPIKTSGQTPSIDTLAMELRVNIRLKRILSECRQQCQDGNMSSDDEERSVGAPFGPAMGLFMNPYHYMPDIYSGISGILGAGMPYPGYHGFPFPTPAVHRAPSPNVVTEEDFQKMFQIHRKRRLANEVYGQL